VSTDTARFVGGVGGLLIGVVYLDLSPPIGVVEVITAIVVLVTRRPGPCRVAVVPTLLALLTAVLVIASVSGPDNPLMWTMAIASGLTSMALLRGGAVARASGR
jgi:hypothetical protein